MRKSAVRSPFCFDRHCVGQKIQSVGRLFHSRSKTCSGIQLADERHDGDVSLLHLHKLALDKRQTFVRPVIDQISNLVHGVTSGRFGSRDGRPLEKVKKWHDSFFDFKMLLHSRAPGLTVTQSSRRIANQLFERISQRCRIAGRNQESSFVVHDRFRNTGQPRRDHWARRRHCLQDHCGKNVAATLAIDYRSECENVGCAQFFENRTLR